MLTFNRARRAARIGTHGRPSPLVQVRIVDPDDRELPRRRDRRDRRPWADRDERLLEPARGERAPPARGGWHHTNDLGRREADGTITFIGPATRMIKSAAENIYPAEVEGCVAKHPAVAECAVIGVPDAEWTQSVKAIVVLHEGADRDRRGDHRALPRPHRVLQEAPHGRVRRGAAARRLRGRLRRPRRAVRRRRLPRREEPERVSDGSAPAVRTGDPDGPFRRRIRAGRRRATASSRAASRTTSIISRSPLRHDGAARHRRRDRGPDRWPWSTCPGRRREPPSARRHAAVDALHRDRRRRRSRA